MSRGPDDRHVQTAESALRAGPDANPPLNMRNGLRFHAAILCVISVLVFALKGKQTRRERDVMEAGRVERDQSVVEVELSIRGVDSKGS